MNCNDAKEKFSDIYDGSKDPQISNHFETCRNCKNDYENFVNALENLRQAGPVEATAHFETETLEAYRLQLERQELLKQTGLEEEPTRVIEKKTMPRFLSLAMAACILAVFLSIFFYMNSSSQLNNLAEVLKRKEIEEEFRMKKFSDDMVAVSPHEWKSKDSMEREWSKAHNLVEYDGMLLSKGEFNLLKQSTIKKKQAAVDNEITKFLDGLTIGASITYKDITVYPLKRATTKIFLVSKLSTLLVNKLKIKESGSTFYLNYENQSDETIFIPGGTILQEGDFDRIVAEDMLLKPASSGKIKTFCAQPYNLKQWVKFEGISGAYMAPLSTLMSFQTGPKQSEIWRNILGLCKSWDISIKESSVAGLYKLDPIKNRMWEVFNALLDIVYKDPDTTGVAISLGNRIDACYIFHDHEFLEKFFQPVIFSCLLELFTRQKNSSESLSSFPNTVFGVKQMIEGMFYADYYKHEHGYAIRSDYSRACALAYDELLSLHIYAGVDKDFDKSLKITTEMPQEKIDKTINDFNEIIKEKLTKERIIEISAIAGQAVTDIILKHIDDQDVRPYCIEALGNRCESAHADTILKYKDSNIQSVAKALSRIADEKSIKFLLQNLNDKNVLKVIPNAVFRAKDKGLKEEIVESLVALYSKEPKEPEALKEALMIILGSTFESADDCRRLWLKNKQQILEQ